MLLLYSRPRTICLVLYPICLLLTITSSPQPIRCSTDSNWRTRTKTPKRSSNDSVECWRRRTPGRTTTFRPSMAVVYCTSTRAVEGPDRNRRTTALVVTTTVREATREAEAAVRPVEARRDRAPDRIRDPDRAALITADTEEATMESRDPSARQSVSRIITEITMAITTRRANRKIVT